MPQSSLNSVDFFPQGWTEEVVEDNYIEWRYDEDEAVLVRVDGTMPEEGYSVIPIAGINDRGEEFVTRPLSGLSKTEAVDAAMSLVYAINGAIGRVTGEPEFNGDDG